MKIDLFKWEKIVISKSVCDKFVKKYKIPDTFIN